MSQADWAEATARKLLAKPLPRRWAHTQGVAATARSLAPVLGPDADLVTAAAWLHDIGYAPDVAATGFHPLDGARHLRDNEGASGDAVPAGRPSFLCDQRGDRARAGPRAGCRVPARPPRSRRRADLLRHDDQPGRPSPAGRASPRRDPLALRSGPSGQPLDRALGAGTHLGGWAGRRQAGRVLSSGRITGQTDA